MEVITDNINGNVVQWTDSGMRIITTLISNEI
jgi:hypothetical protein